MGRKAIIMAVAATSLAAVACSSAVQNRPIPAATVTPKEARGDGIPPVDVGRKTLFVKGNTAPMDFRPGSRDLVQAVEGLKLDADGLHVTAIKTTDDASGVFLVEDAPDKPWGSLLSPAQTALFKEFRSDSKLGRFLILVTDVVVHQVRDPIAPTAFRWERQDIDAYAKCGMPTDRSDPCRQAFYRSATMVVLALSGGANLGK